MEKINEKERQFKNGVSGPKYLIKGPRWEGGLILFKPGEKLGAHLHRQVEEVFYFLEGSGRMFINDTEYSIGAGDVFRVEPGEKHDILNDSAGEDLKGIFIKCPFKPDDKVSL